MAYFLDPEHWTIRGAATFGEPYACIAQGQVQHDRSFYLYGAVGDLPTLDRSQLIADLSALGLVYGWREIQWERRNHGKARLVRFPIANSQ